MLLLGNTKSHVNLYLVITLVDTRHIWKLGKSPLLSCLRQLSYVLLRYVLIFRSPPCWLLNLWLPLLAIPPMHSACSYDPVSVTWNFTLGVWSVMVLWVATIVPQRNLGPPCGWLAHGCATGCAPVSRFLVMIHCRTALMCYFHVSSSLVISPYLIGRSLY